MTKTPLAAVHTYRDAFNPVDAEVMPAATTTRTFDLGGTGIARTGAQLTDAPRRVGSAWQIAAWLRAGEYRT